MTKRQGVRLILALTTFATGGFLMSHFLFYNELRWPKEGIVFSDPILESLPAFDVSLPIFCITYGAILVFLISNLKKVDHISLFGFSAGLLQLIRIGSLYLVPLKPPTELVDLKDPFLDELIYSGEIIGDLFFSGHTATLFLLYFITKKWWFAILGFILMILLLIQHVHYSIDVLAAIPVSYATVWIIRRLYALGDRTSGTV